MKNDGPRQIRLGLERPRRLSAALGYPHTDFPVVLVAGTNGKGSTSALLTSILHHAGYRVGWFRSPSLSVEWDQIGIGTEQIDETEFRRIRSWVEGVGGEVLEDGATPFEALTATAWVHLANREVEIAVLEAGMGGARDATNVTEPVLSMVTSVSLEHTDFLGDTVEAIARDKAGVFRKGRPALGSSMTSGPEGWAALRSEARRIGAGLHDVAQEVTVEGQNHAALTVETPAAAWPLALPFAGRHQRHNLALAVRAAELLWEHGWDRLDADAIRTGVASARLPGRLETIHLASGRTVLLDAAHNPAAVAALVEHLDEMRAGQPGLQIHLLFGVLRDKAVEAMLPPLAERADRVLLTQPPGPRGRPPADLVSLIGRRPYELTADAEAAARRALEYLPPDGVLLVTGSLALVGTMGENFRRRRA